MKHRNMQTLIKRGVKNDCTQAKISRLGLKIRKKTKTGKDRNFMSLMELFH